MPYYVHGPDIDPTNETARAVLTPYATKGEAIAERQRQSAERQRQSVERPGIVISFVADEEERYAWRRREANRFCSGEYQHAPWADRLRLGLRAHEPLIAHYAHLSKEVDGKIAYTPDDQHGHEDRRIRTTAGRYLEQFARGIFTADEIQTFIGMTLPVELKFAYTADEIGAVYATRDYSFESCMGPRYHSASWPWSDPSSHPCRAYAGPDLAIAYLGTPGQRIIARALVWPERKRWNTIKGDTCRLSGALSAAGYRSGDFSGARFSVVRRQDGGFWMPYVDNYAYARREGSYFVITDDIDDDTYSAQNTCGYAVYPLEPENDTHYCHRDGCDHEVGEDATYCESCLDDLRCCDNCSHESFDSDSFYSFDRGTLCSDCESENSHTCSHCEETFNAWDFSSREARTRNMDLCGPCEDDGILQCPACDTYSDPDDWFPGNRVCKACCEDCREAWLESRRAKKRPAGRILRRHSTDRQVRRVA